ncbi:Uncharacterized protein APZ42_033447 [Daphnia magna]|uniref:Peptidase A2 domain-containing protein n=1 Tax=Daphnia magna TaxID=35525 RepID=A0A164L325_9CRUS|nr:Uncharacterized protein APZ42_033447 [Daphnia magna]
MSQTPLSLPTIGEDTELYDWETTNDLVRLKRSRTTGKSIHTKSGNRLQTAIRVGDDCDIIRPLRAIYVRDFEELEGIHDRFLQLSAPDLSDEAIKGEEDWLQAVIYVHKAVLAVCDNYLGKFTNRRTESISSRHSSRASNVSSARVKIQEAERLQKEVEPKFQQAEDEAARRASEDATLRRAEDYQRKVAADRQQRELKAQIEPQRLSGAILKRQINETICDESNPPYPVQVTSSVPSNIPLTKSLPPPTSAVSSSSQTASSRSQDQIAAPNVIRVTTTSSNLSVSTSATPMIGSHHPKSLTPPRLFTPSVPVMTPKPIATAIEAITPNKSSNNPTVTSITQRNVPAAAVPMPVPIPTFVTPPAQSVNVTTSQSTIGAAAQLSYAVSNSAPNTASYVSTVTSSATQTAHRQTHAGLRQQAQPLTFSTGFAPYTEYRYEPVNHWQPVPPAGSSAPSLFLPAQSYCTPLPTSMPLPGNVMTPPLFPSGSPSHTVPPQGSMNRPRVYTPDAWIHTLEEPNATLGRSGVKPPRMKAPSFDGDPRHWPMFIQMFKVFVHDAMSSDAERIAYLYDALTPVIRKDIGGALLNPGLYQHAFSELHKRYGNAQIVSQACTSSLLKLQPFRDNDYKALRAFSADLHSVVATLQLGGYGLELHSHATLSQLVSKLPPALRSRWGEKSWSMQPHLSTVEDLDKWLDGVPMAEYSIRAGFAETPQPRLSKKPTDGKQRGTPSHNVFNTTTDKTDKSDQSRCPGCKSTHPHHLKDCRHFKSVPVEKRAAIVKESNACLRCLGRDHLSRECRRTERCNQANCDGVHHPLLYGAPRLYPKTGSPKTAGFSGSVATGSTKRTLLPIVPVILRANGKETHLFALLDGGSEISVIKKEKATLLGLEGRTERVITKTVDGESRPTTHKIVKFDISSLDGRFTFNIMDVHVMDTFRLNKNSIDLTSLSKKWPHLAHVPIHSVLDEDVAILIGQDHPAAIEIFETRKDPYHQRAPRAYLTAFGWYVAGPAARPEDESRNCFHLSLAENRCDTLLQQFIEFDFFGTKPNVRSAHVQANGTERHRPVHQLLDHFEILDHPRHVLHCVPTRGYAVGYGRGSRGEKGTQVTTKLPDGIAAGPVAEYRSSQSYSSLNQLTPRQPQAESSVGMGQIQQLLTKILRELAKNREDYNALMHKLVSIETKLVNLQDTTSGNNKTKEDMPFPLPITDVADIVPLEDCLKGNKAFYRQLVALIGGLGGSSLSDAVRRAWTSIFSLQVRAACNWGEKMSNGKQKNGVYGIKGVLQFADAKESDLEQETKNFLKRAPEQVKFALGKDESIPSRQTTTPTAINVEDPDEEIPDEVPEFDPN